MTENNERNDISIHSLRMEGDIYNFDNVFCVELFQSTPSAWRETWCYRKVDKGRHGRVISIHSLRMEGDRQRQRLYLLHVISIHSLRMEGDGVANVSVKVILHFNPLPPHGGRPLPLSSWSAWDTFQSTPSAWRETQGERHSGQCGHISIHSLRMEGDPTHGNFSPYHIISIHSLRMEGDHFITNQVLWSKVFQSTPSAWRET